MWMESTGNAIKSLTFKGLQKRLITHIVAVNTQLLSIIRDESIDEKFSPHKPTFLGSSWWAINASHLFYVDKFLQLWVNKMQFGVNEK